MLQTLLFNSLFKASFAVAFFHSQRKTSHRECFQNSMYI